jgi:hypothetical protein
VFVESVVLARRGKRSATEADDTIIKFDEIASELFAIHP